MSKTLKESLTLIITTILLTILVWLPHILALPNFYGLNFSEGFNTIYRNYDGIEYITIAKSLYDPKIISQLPQSLPTNYYAAHFPGYALLILAFAPFLGFLKSMLFVSVLSTILASLMFYKLIKEFSLTSNPLLLALLFLVLPARWLIVHSVGSSEPTFILFVIATIYGILKFELHKKHLWIWLAALSGFAAQLTRPPGALLTLAIGIYVLWKIFFSKSTEHSHPLSLGGRGLGRGGAHAIKIITNYLPLILLPLGLLTIFSLYSITYGDFYMYFKTGDNIHLTFPPFQVFNKAQYWVGDIWLEDMIYIFLLGFSAAFLLFKKNLQLMGIFVLIYMLAGISIAHRDISRYLLPITPFALIAFEKFLTSKEFKWTIAIVILGIYLYSQNYILQNTAPYPNVELFN